MNGDTPEVFDRISRKWFFVEPLLFSVYCTHRLEPNDRLKVPFRTGGMKIEYSRELLASLDDATVEELLKVEVVRVLLKHPYQRQPPFAKRKVLAQASNAAIDDACKIPPNARKHLNGLGYGLPKGLCFEEYYDLVREILERAKPHTNCNTSVVPSDVPGEPDDDDSEAGPGEGRNPGESDGKSRSGEGGAGKKGTKKSGSGKGRNQGKDDNDEQGDGDGEPGSGSDGVGEDADEQIAGLWGEDEAACCAVDDLVEVAESSDTWGSVSGQFRAIVMASRKSDLDWRRMLSIFRTSVISGKRRLTRMRPSRRYGFGCMGSVRELATNLLIAVDVSGSVSDKSLSLFFSAVNRVFRYGVERVDVVQFDTELKSEKPVPMKKARNEIKIVGRGGTDFQCVADFYCAHREYDGLVLFTDGYASKPKFEPKGPIDVLWVLTGKAEYERHKDWIRSLPRNRATFVPHREP